jgi:hypothetical protein
MEVGGECIDPCIFDPGTVWRLVASFTPWHLYAGRRAPSSCSVGDNKCICSERSDVSYTTCRLFTKLKFTKYVKK